MEAWTIITSVRTVEHFAYSRFIKQGYDSPCIWSRLLRRLFVDFVAVLGNRFHRIDLGFGT